MPGLLVERLLDQERVVGDLERLAAGRRRAALDCADARDGQREHRSTTAAARTRTFDAARAPIVNSRAPFTRTLSAAASRSSTSTMRARLQVVALDEVQELAVLIADAADPHRLVQRAGQQRLVGRARDRAFRARESDRRADRPRAARASRRCDRSAGRRRRARGASASSWTSVQLMPITFTRNSSTSRWRRSTSAASFSPAWVSRTPA